MLPSARLYYCLRCHAQVMICSRCDRGQRYCNGDCAQRARLDSSRRSAKRYRATPTGRRNNAERQRRFRQRQRCADKEKVTHQGSPAIAQTALLRSHALSEQKMMSWTVAVHSHSKIGCHWCHQVCDPFLRRRFLHTSTRHSPQVMPSTTPTASSQRPHGH